MAQADLDTFDVLLHSLSVCFASADALQSILELQDSSLPTLGKESISDHRYTHYPSFIYCDVQGSLSYSEWLCTTTRSRLTPQWPFDRLNCDRILDCDPFYNELSLCSKEPIYSGAQSSNELLDSPYRIPPLDDDFSHDCLAIPLSNKASSNHFTPGSEGSQRWELNIHMSEFTLSFWGLQMSCCVYYSRPQSSNELLDSPYRIPPLDDDFSHDCLAIPLSNKASSIHFTTGCEGSQRWELYIHVSEYNSVFFLAANELLSVLELCV